MKKILITLIISIFSFFNCFGDRTKPYVVQDITDEGARVIFDSDAGDNNDQDGFIYGITGLSGRHYPALEVIHCPDYVYTTVAGSQRRIPAFRPITQTDNIRESQRIQIDNTSVVHIQMLKIIELEQENELLKKKIKDMKVAESVFQFVQIQAVNGSSFNQYLFGQMYIQGEFPVMTNISYGLYWIKVSATNGYLPAMTFLRTNTLRLDNL